MGTAKDIRISDKGLNQTAGNRFSFGFEWKYKKKCHTKINLTPKKIALSAKSIYITFHISQL